MRFTSCFPLAALSLTLAACGKENNGSAPAPRGTLIVSVGMDAQTLIPPLVASITDKMVTDMLFEPIAMVSDSLNTLGDAGYEKRLADKWEWARDSLSIAFHLDPRARWQDGRRVVASDVKFTFDLIRNPRSAAFTAENVGSVDSVTVRDSSTFVVWYAARSPEQFFTFVYNVTPIPEHVYGGTPVDKLASSAVARSPVGNGRFRLARWVSGSRIELVADTTSWRGRPELDRLIFSVTVDMTASMAKVLAGEADFVDVLRGAPAREAAKNPMVRPITRPQLIYSALFFRLHDGPSRRPHPIFGERDVRRAIAMAIDRPTLVKSIFDTMATPGVGPILSSRGIVDSSVRQMPFDADGARRLLDKAGWVDRNGDGVREKAGRPLEFTITVGTSSVQLSRAAEIIQEQLKQIGARVKLQPTELSVAMNQFRSRKFDAALLGFQSDPSPGGLKQLWSSGASRAEGGSNSSGYESSAFDAMVDSGMATFDAVKSRALYRRAAAIIVSDVPAVWLYEPLGTGAMHRRVRPASMRPDSWWAHLDEWSIDPKQMIDRDRIGLRPPTNSVAKTP